MKNELICRVSILRTNHLTSDIRVNITQNFYGLPLFQCSEQDGEGNIADFDRFSVGSDFM
jgi:hypothetical protein